MTITLNAPYSTFGIGTSVTLDNATESALVAQGRAVYTVNPGPVFQPLTAIEQQQLRALSASGMPWASRISPAIAGNGYLQWFSDIGVSGALMRSDGTNWRVISPTTLFRKTAITTGLTQTADQIIGLLGPLPAGVLYNGATFVLRYSLGRDVNTDAFGTTTSFRIGTTGTVSDTAISTGNFSGTLGAGSGGSLGQETWQFMASATSVAKAGTANAGVSFANVGSGAPLSSAATISDVTSNALYFSISTIMATAVTSKPQTGYMDLILVP